MKLTVTGLVILLIGGILFMWYPYASQQDAVPSGVEGTTPPSENNVPEITTDDTKNEPRGIVVSAPQPNDLVKFPVTVEGYITGNGWFANEGETGNVQIFDAKGKAVSGIAILSATTDWLQLPTYFKGLVGDREMMSYLETDTGTIRITSQGGKKDDTGMSLEIPVRFR